MIHELKTIRIECDHCNKTKDIQYIGPLPIEKEGFYPFYGFYSHDAGEHYTGDSSGGAYHFTFHFCSHECMTHVKQIKADRIREIYRKEFEREKE